MISSPGLAAVKPRVSAAPVSPASAVLLASLGGLSQRVYAPGQPDTVRPVEGKSSRLRSFSIWQLPMWRPALWPSQIRLASLVSAYFFAV